MSRFINLGHGIVDKETIIGISDPFWQIVERKTRTKNKGRMGFTNIPTKKATQRMYGFNVLLDTNISITVIPTTRPFISSTNTKKFALQVQKELIELLKK